MDPTWESFALMIGALVGIGKLLWDIIQKVVTKTGAKLSDRGQNEVERRRIRSKEDRMIYEDLRERVTRQEEKVDELRSDLTEWKEQYYELHTESHRLRVRNDLLTKSNRQLQKAVVVLRNYLDEIAERLSDYEDIDPPPDISDSVLSLSGINDDLLSKMQDPDVDTPLSEVFDGYEEGESPYINPLEDLDDPTEK